VSKSWWARGLRKEHKRRFEHAAIRLGFTGLRTDPYISRESAYRQAKYNRDNQKLLELVTVENTEGDEYTLAELSKLGTSDKALRRGELMLRIRGCEEIANDLNHMGVFWTITCPSKFHSVGGTNEKYNGATPRDAQAYLCRIFSRMRTAWNKEGIQPYGFRIAEPHTDGCPHWHMLLFIEPEKEPRMTEIIRKYALDEDGHEPGAQENRVKLVQIEAGKGTAAGYIAKYVSKNIDGFGVGDHKAFEDGRTYQISTDLFGAMELTPSMRVTYWSQIWHIRQFQPIGGAPVGIWRELRRVTEETVRQAPAVVKDAWRACQKIEVKEIGADKNTTIKPADFAAYMRAQGGPNIGRRHKIRLAKKQVTIEGRFETYDAMRPCGVYSIRSPDAVYESKRYTWRVKNSSAGAGFALPWTGVNNCTEVDYPALQRKLRSCTKALVMDEGYKKFKIPIWIDWPVIRRQARDIEEKTKNFASRMYRASSEETMPEASASLNVTMLARKDKQ
jgi:hypothetical protein